MVVSLILNIFHFFALGRLIWFLETSWSKCKKQKCRICGSVAVVSYLWSPLHGQAGQHATSFPNWVSTFESSCWGSESQGSNVGKAMHTPEGLRFDIPLPTLRCSARIWVWGLIFWSSKFLSLHWLHHDNSMLLPQLSRTVVAKTSRFRRLRSCAQLKTLAQKPTKAWAMMLTSRS